MNILRIHMKLDCIFFIYFPAQFFHVFHSSITYKSNLEGFEVGPTILRLLGSPLSNREQSFK